MIQRRHREDIDKKYIEWLHTQPCAVLTCDATDITAHHAGDHGFGQRPPDWTAIPLCTKHHLHAFGKYSIEQLGKRFWGHHGLDLYICIQDLRALYGADDYKIISYPYSRTAVFGPTPWTSTDQGQTQRFLLWRRFNTQRNPRILNFCMLNCSTADELNNDPTVASCERRAVQWGYDGLVVTNLFAHRDTNPKGLLRVDDPTGDPHNLEYIRYAASLSATVVVAWGRSPGKITAARGAVVLPELRTIHHTLWCLGENMDCSPKHPLFLELKTELREYRP